MSIRLDRRLKCSGFESADGTFTIRYKFGNGTQSSVMPNPGQPYTGTSRDACVPCVQCSDGFNEFVILRIVTVQNCPLPILGRAVVVAVLMQRNATKLDHRYYPNTAEGRKAVSTHTAIALLVSTSGMLLHRILAYI